MQFESSNDVIGDTAPRPNPDKPAPGGLKARVLSGLVLAPPVLAALYFGPPYSDVLLLLAGGIMAWEWSRLCSGGTLDRTGTLVIATALAALMAGALGAYSIAGWILAAGVMGVAVVGRGRSSGHVAWMVLGLVYVVCALLAFQWLRQDPEVGRATILWLIAAVWATDIGAYFAGRAIGGPKLAPRISPKKTWAGLAGGMCAAAAVGVVSALLATWPNAILLALISALLAVVAQLGDLFESGVKRHFGVKDSSNLIPGHGGLLDRADGLMSGSLAVALLVLMIGMEF
jgi:phosphatidate cytidylyltransferase